MRGYLSRLAGLVCALPLVGVTATAVAEEPTLSSISPEFAEFNGLRHAVRHYGELHPFDHQIYYDWEGRPLVYAMVFVREYSPGMDDLRTLAVAAADEWRALEEPRLEYRLLDRMAESEQDRRTLRELAQELYKQEQAIARKDEYVTVLCGGTKDLPPIIRSYRGLPNTIVHAARTAEALRRDARTRVAILGDPVFVDRDRQYYRIEQSHGRQNRTAESSFAALAITVGGGSIATVEAIRAYKTDQAAQPFSSLRARPGDETDDLTGQWRVAEILYERAMGQLRMRRIEPRHQRGDEAIEE